MLKIEVAAAKRNPWVAVSVAFSLAAHLGFAWFAAGVDGLRPADSGLGRVEFETRVIEPEPEPPQALPVVPPVPEPEPAQPVVRRTKPKPNKRPVQTPPKSAEPKVEAKPVFGVTAESVGDSGSGVAVRVGNTLEKQMEKEVTPLEDVAPLGEVPDTGPLVDEDKASRPTKPVPIYELSEAPRFKTRVEPEYPPEAREKGVEGTVHLELLIDENGRVKKIRVLSKMGHGLEKAAVTAAIKSSFEPGEMNGRAVPVKIKVPYRFVLSG